MFFDIGGSNTMALYCAKCKKNIPIYEDYHDPNIVGEDGHTVAYYLKKNHLPIPNGWYDNSMKDTPKHPKCI